MKMPDKIDSNLIAPCGVNCGACGAHLDAKKPCPGCRAPEEAQIRKSCRNCAKKNCAFARGHAWCFECGRFPCARIKRLNARYTQHYGVDLVQNGLEAKVNMQAFLLAQRERFQCKRCGGVISQHKGMCSECGAQG